MHVGTRIRAVVDSTPDAELRCNICEDWKAPADFSIERGRPEKSQAETYKTCCKPCNSLATKLGGTGSARAALVEGVAVSGALNKAHHTQGQTHEAKPLSTKAREELRERREELAGIPSKCYLVGMEGDRSAVKIGHSTNVYRRMAQYQAGNPRKLVVIGLLDGGQATEQRLHRKFMHLHDEAFVGEWFRMDPAILTEFKVKAGTIK